MEKLKDSQEMLNFLKDLSKFTQAFGNIDPSAFMNNTQKSSQTPPKKEESSPTDDTIKTKVKMEKDEKNPQSPTQGIADEFIQNILESYLNKSRS